MTPFRGIDLEKGRAYPVPGDGEAMAGPEK